MIYHYTPSNTLTPGQYTVVETQNPPNTTNGTPTSNGVPVSVPPGTPPDTIPVTLPPGGDSLQNNFPKLTTAKVSGFVYQDNNNNGKFDAGDAPIANASVTISGTPAGGGTAVTMTELTTANGSYSFTVPPGDYTITQPNITGYTRGADTVGNLGGTAAPGALTVSLTNGDVGTDYDFGEVLPPPVVAPKVSGFVYQDNNNDGKFDAGDAALPNAVVSITGTPTGGGAAVTQTTLTAANGSYAFTVPPGDYTITQPNITGYTRGADTVGNLGGTAAPGALTVSLASGDVGTDYDFGEVLPPAPPQVNPAKVSGFVYQDNNNDGKFDAGDAAMPNAVVSISGTPTGWRRRRHHDHADRNRRLLFLHCAARRLHHHAAEHHRLHPRRRHRRQPRRHLGPRRADRQPGQRRHRHGLRLRRGAAAGAAAGQPGPGVGLRLSGQQQRRQVRRRRHGPAQRRGHHHRHAGRRRRRHLDDDADGGERLLFLQRGARRLHHHAAEHHRLHARRRHGRQPRRHGGPRRADRQPGQRRRGNRLRLRRGAAAGAAQINPAQVSGFVYQDNNNDGKFDAGDTALPNAVVTITGTPAGGGAAITQTMLTAADGSYSFSVAPGNYTITQPNITGYTRGADTVGNLGGTSVPGR